jgi:hypothetical protein
LDQPAARNAEHLSLNADPACIKVVDTLRCVQPCIRVCLDISKAPMPLNTLEDGNGTNLGASRAPEPHDPTLHPRARAGQPERTTWNALPVFAAVPLGFVQEIVLTAAGLPDH